ncbi:MAG: hypothetical protein U5P41_16260 [Gammaproteobacteria bacterium]|nr:hypothetical protein [Gammaproteobacteria bacterium]
MTANHRATGSFADGFAGDGGLVESPEDAEFRPAGLAVGPGGSLYVADSVRGVSGALPIPVLKETATTP